MQQQTLRFIRCQQLGRKRLECQTSFLCWVCIENLSNAYKIVSCCRKSCLNRTNLRESSASKSLQHIPSYFSRSVSSFDVPLFLETTVAKCLSDICVLSFSLLSVSVVSVTLSKKVCNTNILKKKNN